MGVVKDGHTVYLDFERIRKVDGFVYFWRLVDNLKPDKHGDLSYTTYYQGDCKLFRFKVLIGYFYKDQMGRGTGEIFKPKGDDANWLYPSPKSSDEINLKKVCRYANQ